MTDKWADYLISAVQYNPAQTHIVKVRAHPDRGDTVGDGVEMLRTEVIAKLASGTTFVTITRSGSSWNQGAAVGTVTIDGERFIRTARDATKRDNLGALPTF